MNITLKRSFVGLIRCLSLFLLVPVLAACSDDDEALPVSSPDENDEFIGEAKSFSLGAEASGLTSNDITLKILAPDGNIISRQGLHSRKGDASNFTLGSGLKDGTYRLLYAEYPIGDNPALANLADKYETAQYGLGCRIAVKGNTIMVCDGFDDGIGLTGSGTKDDPYIISSYAHLIKLMKYVNSYDTNKNITPETYFKQTNAIDMEQASFECDMRYGWLPIGADTNTPFRGVYQGDELAWLWVDRPNSSGVGLFGYVFNAVIDGVCMSHADIKGNFAVGALAGAAISGGDDHGKSSFINCTVTQSTVAGSPQSVSVGGLVGSVDMYSSVLVQKSSSDDCKVSGSYNVGGLIGGCGIYSLLSVGDCTNSSTVTGECSGIGGMVGVADTLNIVGCKNTGKITGATAYSASDINNSYIGTGGLCGGSGMSWLSACVNSGEIKGAVGVGGLIGTTRIKGGNGEAYMYNNTLLRWCSNSGNVSGQVCTGGLCGEAQFGSYGVVNKGTVSGGDYTAGIVGNTSIAVAHNAVNIGNVTGGSYCAGIVGKTTWGSIAIDHNYGNVTGRGSHTAGIMGLAGNNTIVHYCGNFGTVAGSGSGTAAGIVAEIGDPRVWTAMNITECVVGSLELVMAVAGPVIAIAEHAVEGVAKGVAIALKVSEITFDSILTATDTGLAGYGLYELLEPEEEEELHNSLHEMTTEVSDEIKREIEATRIGFTNINAGDFNNACLSVDYNNSISSTLSYYETDGNDEIFNENINKRREERMEELEKAHESVEILHEVIAGVSILLSAVGIVGSVVASGGAAVPFVLAGCVASITGGVNAITKSVMDFEENAVVISQCVNAGSVTGSKSAGIVGVLQDNSIVTDCLNSAALSEPLVYDTKSKTRVEYCMVLNDTKGKFNTGDCKDIVYYSPSSSFNDDVASDYSTSGRMPMSAAEIRKTSSYHRSGSIPTMSGVDCVWSINWDIGNENNKWIMSSGSGNVFPVPAYSEMRR